MAALGLSDRDDAEMICLGGLIAVAAAYDGVRRGGDDWTQGTSRGIYQPSVNLPSRQCTSGFSKPRSQHRRKKQAVMRTLGETLLSNLVLMLTFTYRVRNLRALCFAGYLARMTRLYAEGLMMPLALCADAGFSYWSGSTDSAYSVLSCLSCTQVVKNKDYSAVCSWCKWSVCWGYHLYISKFVFNALHHSLPIPQICCRHRLRIHWFELTTTFAILILYLV